MRISEYMCKNACGIGLEKAYVCADGCMHECAYVGAHIGEACADVCRHIHVHWSWPSMYGRLYGMHAGREEMWVDAYKHDRVHRCTWMIVDAQVCVQT